MQAQSYRKNAMGHYVRTHLIKDEHLVFETGYHWIIFISLKAIFTLFISPLIAINTSEFCITNRRIVMKTGMIVRRTMEMNLSKIESVNVEQNILGRILDYGRVIIHGTGGSTENFSYIKAPAEFRKQFEELC